MEIRKILAVIFDLDGTLVKLPIDYVGLRNDLREAALKYGMDSEFRPIIGEVGRLARLLENGTSFIEECIRIIDYYENKAAESAEPIKGAKDCLSLLKSKGKKIAVVSNNSTSCIRKALKNVGFLHWVDVLVGREGLRVKPDPHPIILAINALNIKNDNAVMVGDSEIDAMAAERAGVRAHIFKGGDLFAFVCFIEGL